MKMVSSFVYSSFLTLIVLLFCVYMPLGTMCFTMKLIPRVDIDPILFPKNISEEEKHNRILQLSEIHALNYLVSNTNTITPQTLQPGVKNYGNFYVVEIRIGTTPKPHQAYLLLDTGSDDTWLQCAGCTECFPIAYENFKYSESHTFKEVSCDDPLCVPKKCSPTGNKCIYDTSYAGGANSKGIVLSETFLFPDPSNIHQPFIVFQKVVFGCGLQNKGITFGRPMDNRNIVAGIFGIGTGTRSFLTQLSAETKMRLSYCLNSPQSSQSQTSYLHFGNDAKISGDFQTTQLLTRQGFAKLTRYYAVCTGISLFGKMLPINPDLFKLKPNRVGGFVFDSGSAATFLVGGAFNVLKQSVIEYFETHYKLHPFTGRKLGYDLCYLNVPNSVVAPRMAYHFQGGARLEVDPNSLFLTFKANEGNMFCMNVAVVQDERVPSIVGARHQSNHVFLFDVEKNEISFNPMPHACV